MHFRPDPLLSLAASAGRECIATATLQVGDVMVLTRSFVRAKRPCTDGFRWFVRQFDEGGNYQDLLDTMVAAGRAGDACWLLEQFGPTNEVRELDAIEADAVVFAGTLRVRGGVDVEGKIHVGRTLQVGGGVRVGGDLIVGEDLRVEGNVRVDGNADIGADVRVGWGLEVLSALRCGGELRAGWDLRCGAHLELGGNAVVGQDLHCADELRCFKGLQLGGDLCAENSVRVDQGIVAGGSVSSALHLEVGWGIRAGGAICAQGSIRAGESLEAGEAICAGEGYGVFAGLDVQTEAWEACARVSAPERPAGLMSGWWAGPSALLARAVA